MKSIFLPCFVFVSIAANAQSLKAALKDLSFMAGNWMQAHKWGDMEEYWGEPMGDNMICSYRCVKNGKTVFYEFIVIEQDSLAPVMKLRHFNRGSIAWEEKDKPYRYPLVSLKPNEAVFAAADNSLKMTYRRIAPDKLDIILEEGGKTEIFNYSALQPKRTAGK